MQGKRHSNLVFDVALPADLRGQEDTIQHAVEQALNKSSDIVYHVVITFDNAAFA